MFQPRFLKIFILFAICKMFFVLAIFTTKNRTDRALFIMCLLKISLLESSLLYVLRTGFLRHKILRDCTAGLPCGMVYVVRVFCIFQPETREKRSSRIKAFKPETISAEKEKAKDKISDLYMVEHNDRKPNYILKNKYNIDYVNAVTQFYGY